MANIDRLYDAFGELIYAVAKSDGKIHNSEIVVLKEMLEGHPWATNIEWSFNYESRKQNSFEDTFRKGLITCQEFGPSEDYDFLIEILDKVAGANQGISDGEKVIIERFKTELKNTFIK